MKKMNSKEPMRNKRTNGGSIMKKILLLAGMVFATVQLSYAQNNASQGVTLAATVIKGLSTGISGQDNFGTIVAGTTPSSLNAQSGTVGSGSGNISLITITGNNGTLIHITFDATDLLTGPGTSITYTPSVYGASSSSSQSTSSQVLNNATVNLSATGNYYFWIGGSLSALPAAQTPGTYSGTWTLTVNY